MTNTNTKINLKDLGYDNFFKSKQETTRPIGHSIARIIAEHKESYRVKDTDGEYLAKITGKQIFEASKRKDYPAVGDWVVITKPDKEIAIINEILPRKTILSKKYSNKQDIQIIATNIDIAFIVESMNRDYNLNRFERYLVLANEGNIKPTIILNKIDLISSEDLELKIKQLKERFDNIDIILTSTTTGQGLDELRNYIQRGKTYCFIGSSGVGKSSLINKLLEKDKLKTNKISNTKDKGKHTTTSREMYFLENGGIVIDNPGTREVGIGDTDKGLDSVFDEINNLSIRCRYPDCTHTCEPGCAIQEAIKTNKLDKEKYLNYTKLKKESEYYEMTDFEKRGKERNFGKLVKKTLKGIEKYKP